MAYRNVDSYRPETVVRCDNPKCTAVYNVSAFLGGHTFTCNQCGSRVTIRDLSFIGSQSRVVKPRHQPPLRVKTPMLDKVLAEQGWMRLPRQLLKVATEYWVMLLFVAVFGSLLVMGHC